MRTGKSWEQRKMEIELWVRGKKERGVVLSCFHPSQSVGLHTCLSVCLYSKQKYVAHDFIGNVALCVLYINLLLKYCYKLYIFFHPAFDNLFYMMNKFCPLQGSELKQDTALSGQCQIICVTSVISLVHYINCYLGSHHV